MKRKIEACREVMQHLDILGPFEPVAWLTEQANGATCWLLAHADDGVIWGKVENGVLMTARDAAQGTAHERTVNDICPPLREVTLHMARLFNEYGEVLVWRDGNTGEWRARMIYAASDAPQPTFKEALDEHHLLWGNQATAITAAFTLLNDSGQGLRHVVPVAVDASALPLRLRVRHLISEEDDTGFARIAASRLVTLEEKS